VKKNELTAIELDKIYHGTLRTADKELASIVRLAKTLARFEGVDFIDIFYRGQCLHIHHGFLTHNRDCPGEGMKPWRTEKATA
jgi:hypothetical protein